MKNSIQINVIKELNSILNTREAATYLLNIIREEDVKFVVFDFSGIEFMSRSFADQFHKESNDIQKKNYLAIQITNANEEIINILQTVARTQNKKERNFIKLPVYNYSDPEMLSDYLLSV